MKSDLQTGRFKRVKQLANSFKDGLNVVVVLGHAPFQFRQLAGQFSIG